MKKIAIFLMVFAVSMFIAHYCFANAVILQWAPNTETDLAGYKIYYKANSADLPFDGAGAVEGVAPIDVSNQTSATITGLDPGTDYYFAVTAYNTSGLESSYSNIISIPAIKDVTAPTVSLGSPVGGATVSGVVTISATANDDVGVSKVELYENGSLIAAGNLSPCSFAWNTAALANGSYTLSAKAYDAAGNYGSSSVQVSVLNDSYAPTVSIASPVTNAIVSGPVAVSANASDDVAVSRVEFYVNGALQGTSSISPYAFTWNTAGFTNGSYTLTAKAYDSAGNIGNSGGVTVTVQNLIDNIAPIVSITAPAKNASLKGIKTIKVSATDNVKVAKVEIYVNGSLLASDTLAPYAFSWNTAGYPQGSNTLLAKAYDASGNFAQSTLAVYVDRTPPVVTISSPTAGSQVGASVTIRSSAVDNRKVSSTALYIDGVLKTNVSGNTLSWNWGTTSYAAGSHVVLIKSTDEAGNTGIARVATVVDAVAPTAAIVTPSKDGSVNGTKTIKVSALDNVKVAKVVLYLNGVLIGSDTLAPYSFSWNTAGSPEGANTLTAKAYDAAGNMGQISMVVYVDRTAPVVTISSPAAGSRIGSTASIQASASDNRKVVSLKLYIDGVLKSTASGSTMNWAWNASAYAAGYHTIKVKAFDEAGNAGLKTISVRK